jgi:integrase
MFWQLTTEGLPRRPFCLLTSATALIGAGFADFPLIAYHFHQAAVVPLNNKNMLRRHFRPAIKAANCPRIRFHDLRHTNASIRFANGESIKYVQTQLGHSSPSITLNIYPHLLKPTNQEAACRLENAILGEDGSKMVAIKEKGLRPKAATP